MAEQQNRYRELSEFFVKTQDLVEDIVRENAQLRKENAEFKREVMELRRAELSLPDVRQLSQSCRRIVRPMSHPFPELES